MTKIKTILCNDDTPPATKIAHLTGNKAVGYYKAPTKDGLRTFCKFNGKKMLSSEALNLMYQQIKDENIVLVNHAGSPLRYNAVITAHLEKAIAAGFVAKSEAKPVTVPAKAKVKNKAKKAEINPMVQLAKDFLAAKKTPTEVLTILMSRMSLTEAQTILNQATGV